MSESGGISGFIYSVTVCDKLGADARLFRRHLLEGTARYLGLVGLLLLGLGKRLASGNSISYPTSGSGAFIAGFMWLSLPRLFLAPSWCSTPSPILASNSERRVVVVFCNEYRLVLSIYCECPLAEDAISEADGLTRYSGGIPSIGKFGRSLFSRLFEYAKCLFSFVPRIGLFCWFCVLLG